MGEQFGIRWWRSWELFLLILARTVDAVAIHIVRRAVDERAGIEVFPIVRQAVAIAVNIGADNFAFDVEPAGI